MYVSATEDRTYATLLAYTVVIAAAPFSCACVRVEAVAVAVDADADASLWFNDK